MYVFARRFFILSLFILALSVPALADNVTVSGTVNFASLDGSSLDHDGAANGVFTVDDGDLTVLGTIQCLDDGPGGNSACAMAFAVSGSFTMQPGSALRAENRKGTGSGGNITITAGQDVVLAGSNASAAGAIVSTAADGSATGSGGNVTITAGGNVRFESGSLVGTPSKGGQAGAISVTAEGSVEVGGVVASGPASSVTATRYTGAVLTPGATPQSGGNISIVSHSHTEPAVVVTGSAVIVSQGGSGSAGSVTIEGCGIDVSGLVASVSGSGPTAKVTINSGTTLTLDGSDLGAATGTRRGMVRADALQEGAGAYSANLFARENLSIAGPASGSLTAVTSNGGATSNDASGTINVISTNGAIATSGNALAATNANPGDQGGTIDVAAAGSVTLSRLNASGDHATNNPSRAGGKINVRSHTAHVSWQNGSGDVRPTGSASGIPAAKQGTITITYCTTYALNGSTFATNGPAAGSFPTTVQSCSPAEPSLPAGVQQPDCNDPPIAANDVYGVDEGGSLNVAAPGVLGNDVDPDGDAMTAVLVSGPAHASSFTFNADGSFSYTHNDTENHSDSFTYRASDGMAQSNLATVTIAVTPVNDAPVANDDAYTVAEGGTINYAAPGVLANDSDVDGPAMSAVLVSAPAHASSFVLNADGSFLYVHDGSETLSDSFSYKANDGSLDSNVATVAITITPVNDAPVANNDSATVAEGGTLSGASVLGNDTDAENDALTATLVSGPAHAASFTLNADGTYTYVHDGGETTSDSFTYKSNDGAADSNVATVSITVTPVNDAPVAAGDAYTVAEGGTHIENAPGVLGNDTDAENDSLTAVLVSGPANAQAFTLNGNGSFTYTHDGSETTSDSFTYKANDGTDDSNVVTVTIAITPVNDAPVANDDSASVDEGGTLSGASVLANDTDAENDALTATLVSGPANAASFTLNADGTYTYVHDGSETTTDSFTYKANDGALDSNVATVTIAINPVNDAPVAAADSYSVAEGGTLNPAAPGVLGNDTDAENDSLSAVLVSGPANASSFTLNANGSFSYVHDGSETTADSFSYKANDGSADSNVVTVTISITAVNDAPVAVGDAYSVDEGGTLSGSSVLANDTDAENDPLTAVLVSGPANAASFTLNADGTFTYVHNGSETTGDSFTYRANDGSANSNVVTVTIAITPVNDAPVANNDAYSVSSHGTLTVPAPGVLGNDTDADSASITATLVSGPANASSFTLNADGSFTYVSNGTTGTDSFTYAASDGTAQSNVATVTITVIAQPPVATDDAYVAVGNTELRVGTGSTSTPHAAVSGSVLNNDADPDTPAASLAIASYDATSANGGTVTMNANGTFTYLPPAVVIAPDSFNYVVTDGTSSDSGTVHITFSGRVWYVRNDASSGDGRSNAPYNTLAAAASMAQVNDTIYVHRGNGTILGHSPITLTDGQRLIGEGVALVAGPYTLHPAGSRPTLNAVTLANGNEVAGANITSAGIGINGDLAASGSIHNVDITGGTDGIVLTNTSGSFNISNVNVTPGGAGVSITGTANVSFSNVAVTTAGSIGISGSGSGTVTFNGGSVTTTNATAVTLTDHTIAGSGLISVSAANAVNGIVLTNTGGTFAVVGTGAAGSGGTIAGMSGRGVHATNAAGVTLKSMIVNNSGVQGVLVQNALAGASTVDVSNSSFVGNFSNGVQAINDGAGLMTVSADANTFTSNNGAVIVQTTSGPLTAKVTNNAATFNGGTPFAVNRSNAGSGVVEATITGNTVGTAGVAASGATCGGACNGITVVGAGSNAFRLLLSNNQVRHVDAIGVRILANVGSTALSATITNNVIAEPEAGVLHGLQVQSGSTSTDTTSVCAAITGNTISGGWSSDITVRNFAAGSTFSLPGYSGLGTDTTAVANFIKANNTVTTVSAFRKTSTPTNEFSGGPACATPAP